MALEPGAQVVRHFHPLQVDRAVHVGPVRLALEPALPDQHAVGPLEVVDEQRSGCNPASHGLPHARRAGLSAAADDRDGVLVHVYRYADAELLVGLAALARLPVADTLKAWAGSGRPVPVPYGHIMDGPDFNIGTAELVEDEHGLKATESFDGSPKAQV